jgi:hypothetical protein
VQREVDEVDGAPVHARKQRNCDAVLRDTQHGEARAHRLDQRLGARRLGQHEVAQGLGRQHRHAFDGALGSDRTSRVQVGRGIADRRPAEMGVDRRARNIAREELDRRAQVIPSRLPGEDHGVVAPGRNPLHRAETFGRYIHGRQLLTAGQ